MGTNQEIVERRKSIVQLLGQGLTQLEIAEIMRVSQPQISRDMNSIIKESKNFSSKLAMDEMLNWYLLQHISGIEADIRDLTLLYRNDSDENKLNSYQKLLCKKLLIEAHYKVYDLYKEGPVVIALRGLKKQINEMRRLLGLPDKEEEEQIVYPILPRPGDKARNT